MKMRQSTISSTICLAAVIFGGFLPVRAADVLADARACATERDDAARRLACYDAQFRPAPFRFVVDARRTIRPFHLNLRALA
jgi:hypothetical protein